MKLPRGWVEASLGDLCEKPQYGWTTKAKKINGGLRLLRTTDITPGRVDWSSVPFCEEEPVDVNRYLLADGDIVVSRAGSVGVSLRIRNPEPAIFASYLIRLRPLSGFDTDYLAWFLKSPLYWRQVERASAGIALQNINAKKLAAMRIPVAPVGEQRRIVEAIEEQFSRLDAAGESQRSAAHRCALFVASLRDRMAQAAGTVLRLAELGELVTGTTPSTKISEYWGPGLPFVTPGDFVHGGRVEAASREITENGLARARLVPAQSVLLTCIGATIGKTGLAQVPCVTNQQITAIVPSADKVVPTFLFHVLCSPSFQKLVLAGASSTTMPILNKGRLSELRVRLPSLAEQLSLVEELERGLSVAVAVNEALRAVRTRSDSIRRAVLREAFGGRLVSRESREELASEKLETTFV